MRAAPLVPVNRLTDPAAAEIARAILARSSGVEALDGWTSKVLLAAYGVPVSRQCLVQSRAAAIEAATEEIGFPCALELGAFRRGGLREPAEIAAAYDEISLRPGFAGAWLHEVVADGVSRRIRVSIRQDGELRLDGNAAGADPALAGMLAMVAELAQDLCDAIAAIELDPVILLPDRIVAVGAAIAPRRGNT